MDRTIEKKKWPASKIILILVAATVVIFLCYLVMGNTAKTRLKVDPTRMTMSKVSRGEFL